MKIKYWLASVSVISLGLLFVDTTPSNTKADRSIQLGLPFAHGTAAVDCNSIIESVMASEPVPGTYTAPALDHIHRQLYRFNRVESADIELIFCRLVNHLGMNPDLTSLPQSISKSRDGHTVVLDVTVPTETWATTLGYEAKATITYDSTQFLAMWWSGNSESSKGFLIQGANPMHPDGIKHLKYAQWDRTTVDQNIKIYATAFQTNYLTEPNYPDPMNPTRPGGDRAHFGRASYNTTTKAVTAQTVEVRQDRNTPTNFICVKTQMSGNIDGNMSAYRPNLGTPDVVTDTHTDGTNMDGASGIVDSASTAANSGTYDAAPATLPAAFDYSCANINTAGTSGAFQGNQVNFSASPTDIFPN